MVKINRKLNLVVPIGTGSDTIYFHSTPIGRQVIDANIRILGLTFAEIYTSGLGPLAGPRIAGTLLTTIATDQNILDKVQKSLINEIYRLTNVLMPMSQGGWETIPFEEVKRRELVDEDDLREVENALVYFTVAHSMHLKREAEAAREALTMMWLALFTYSNITEFMNSLKTSTGGENIGEKATPSSIPF